MIGSRRKRGSIRLALVEWVVIPLLGVLVFIIWLGVENAARQASLVTDTLLTASARVIAEQLRFEDGDIVATIPPAALEMFASESHDRAVYRVIGPKGELIAGYADLAAPPVTGIQPTYAFDTIFRAEPMRAIAFEQPVVTTGGTVPVLVVVAETVLARDALFRSIWLPQIIAQAVLVLVAAGFIWIGVSREIAPLLAFTKAVRTRRLDKFEPFSPDTLQPELRPLVAAINDYMERLERQVVRQRGFLDSAAHQLRTPLAVLKTQVGYALRSVKSAEKDEALVAVDEDLTAMTRLTNQLLLLARAEHDRPTVDIEPVDVAALAREVSAAMAPRALDAGVDIVVDADQTATAEASQFLVRELIANLVDNAVRYAGQGATATIAVTRRDAMVVIAVSDTGAGLSASDRQRVFNRFQRGTDAPGYGSGLGLSIVAEIAALFGGEARLRPVKVNERGFGVEVALPASPGAGARA